MKFKTTLFFVFLLLSNLSFSQNTMRTFKGRVLDSATFNPLGDVSICIYRASDTFLMNFGFTTPNGNFSLTTKSTDSLLISVSLLNYEEFSYRDPAKDGWNFKNFGDIKLSKLPFQFKGVKVKTAAIRMNGDTIEINANRFKVLPGSDVAQLFKKIPGFEINVKGEIKVGGADVSKIMVDGSDFFGNNPGMVSKNLNADMIETVQVFDDRNEDGSPKENLNKVINLKLKKGKRNGLFGDFLGGYGTNDRYESGIRLNSFKNDRKMSFVVNSNNINETGFDFGFNNWHRASNSGRNGSSMSEDNFYYFESGDDEGNINQKSNMGMTYFNEFKRQRKLSFNFSLSQNKFNSINSSNSIFALNDSTRRTNKDSTNSNGLKQSANFDVTYTKKIDSVGYFDIGVQTNIEQKDFESKSYNSLGVNSVINNLGVTEKLFESSKNNVKINSSLRRSFRKNKAYYYSISGSYDRKNSDGNAFQFTQNNFDTFNNRNVQNTKIDELLVKGYIRVPIYKKTWMFNISGDYWLQNNVSNQESRDAVNKSKQFEQDYMNKVDSLSIQFSSTQTQNSFKPYISYEKKGIYISAGYTFLQMNIINDNSSSNTKLNKPYSRSLPFFNVSLYPQNKFYMHFTASKYTTFPSLNELQPIFNIANTYERNTGNIDLTPQDNFGIRLYANLYKLKGFRHFYNSFNAEFSDNAKVLESKKTESGIILNQYTNASGYANVNDWLGTSKRLTKKFNANMNLNFNYNKNPNIVNNEKSFAIRNSLGLSPGISWNYSDSLELGVSTNWDYSSFKNTLNTGLDYTQNIFSYSADIRTVFKTGTELNSEISIADNRKIPGIGKLVTVWSLYIQQPLGKKGKYNIKFSAYDIFKQNTNIYRNISNNYIFINQNNRLQRYFMLTLVYKIKKTGNDENFEYTY
jgi:hypothetical protein